MTYPKIIDCPKCGAAGEELTVYKYDNGWQHVECDGCHYMSVGEGSALQAIRSHNENARRMAATARRAA